MPKIAISYRKADPEAITGRIFDRLVAHPGQDAFFHDRDGIPLGIEFCEPTAAVLDGTDITSLYGHNALEDVACRITVAIPTT